jgi:hypothetical protein
VRKVLHILERMVEDMVHTQEDMVEGTVHTQEDKVEGMVRMVEGMAGCNKQAHNTCLRNNRRL